MSSKLISQAIASKIDFDERSHTFDLLPELGHVNRWLE